MTSQVIQSGQNVRVVVDAPTVTVGPTTTLPVGQNATVTNIGTGNELVLAFGIPRGSSGSAGGGDMYRADNLSGLTDYSAARNNLGLGSLAVLSSVNDANWSGADLSVANGGTGSSTPAAARIALGLGTLATQSNTFTGSSTGTNTGDQTDISGNAGSATILATPRNINGVPFNGSGNITVSAVDTATPRLAAASNLSDLGSAATARTNLGLGTLATQSGTFSGTSSGTNTGDQTSVTGNAGTATALQTARTINGVSFNGTANITVSAVDTATPRLALTELSLAVNFTAAADAYIPARVAQTIAQGNALLGTGTIAYAKSTAAAPSTFNTTSLPATLEAGAWLKVSASAVTGFVAVDLYRSA